MTIPFSPPQNIYSLDLVSNRGPTLLKWGGIAPPFSPDAATVCTDGIPHTVLNNFKFTDSISINFPHKKTFLGCVDCVPQSEISNQKAEHCFLASFMNVIPNTKLNMTLQSKTNGLCTTCNLPSIGKAAMTLLLKRTLYFKSFSRISCKVWY